MRYYVCIRAWRQGEFEARVAEQQRVTDRDLDNIIEKQSRTYMLEANSSEEALAEAKELYVKDGMPPQAEWSDVSFAEVVPVPYLTIRELLTAPVLRSEAALWGDSPVDDYLGVDWRAVEVEGRVRKDYYADPYIDGRRIWELAIVYFDDKPAYVSQCAGREGRDHKNTFLISRDTKAALVTYLHTKVQYQEPEEEEWSLDKESLELTCFYSNSLGDILERKAAKQAAKEAKEELEEEDCPC